MDTFQSSESGLNLIPVYVPINGFIKLQACLTPVGGLANALSSDKSFFRTELIA